VEHFFKQKFELLNLTLLVGHKNMHTKKTVDILEESKVVRLTSSDQKILECLKSCFPDGLREVVDVSLDNGKNGRDVLEETSAHSF